MSQQAVSQVVAKAMTDANFRAQLAANHDEAIKGLGVTVTPTESKAIASLNIADWNKLSLNDINSRIGKVASWEVSKITSKAPSSRIQNK